MSGAQQPITTDELHELQRFLTQLKCDSDKQFQELRAEITKVQQHQQVPAPPANPQQVAGNGAAANPPAAPNGVGNAGGGGAPPNDGIDGVDAKVLDAVSHRIAHRLVQELARGTRPPILPAPTAQRRRVFDYIAGSVLFASSYLALDGRSRRGIAQVLPLVPAGVAAIEWARKPDRDSGLSTVASGAVGVGSLFLAPR